MPIDMYHRWWTVISANYLHGSLLHILFNMVAVRQLGALIVQEYGVYRTFSIYTISGVGGYLFSYLAGVPFTVGLPRPFVVSLEPHSIMGKAGAAISARLSTSRSGAGPSGFRLWFSGFPALTTGRMGAVGFRSTDRIDLRV